MEDEFGFLPELPDLPMDVEGPRTKCPGCGADVRKLIEHVCKESAGDEADACYTDLVDLFTKAASGEVSSEEKRERYLEIKERYKIRPSSHMRQTPSAEHATHEVPPSEVPPSAKGAEATYETPAWCLDCLRKHTDLAIGLLDESQQFFNEGNIEKSQHHAEEAIRQISLAELHASSAPPEIKEDVKPIGSGLRGVRKNLYKADVGLRSREPRDGSVLNQAIQGLNKVQDLIHQKWAEVV